MEEHHKEMHFLSTTTPAPSPPPPPPPSSAWPSIFGAAPIFRPVSDDYEGPPSLDLQLSISLTPISNQQRQQKRGIIMNHNNDHNSKSCIEALKWQAEEQIRLAAMEKAYAERVRELTRREMEMAQTEFARAKNMWERAREEVEKAERMKERATRKIDSTCMEITCQSCRQKFRP